MVLLAEECAGFRKNPLRLIAETEERFFAPGKVAAFGKRKHFLRCHEESAGLTGILSKGAVAAIVAAKSGEGDEYFSLVGNDSSLPVCTDRCCVAQHVWQRGLL